ncbi:MAG: mannose-1-phosphate guanylyltransferase/mannose-6-phosphate isomerase [Alphaproteobacteria bacterium]|nr:mannose-1-phosphate guanylyltransferase/mannose-6-phosphate isomerase [Alphaproteobacteria bacterium]MBL7097211.1 mannose-1-phosphate guanylyltransferase/mannose-6-phosphate isomerase [Alphaproteobacteria bacterium]
MATATTSAIHPVILSGGSGTRLWPLSRRSLPKQLLALNGKRTMIQDTVMRAAEAANASPPILLCNEAHRFIVAEQMQEIGIVPASIVLEPFGRNTAPAAAVAALLVAEEDTQGAVLLLPSDHVVTDRAAFLLAVAQAHAAAMLGHIVTFGVHPQAPETGYGYIERGEPAGDAFLVRRFVEKPNRETAESYCAAGNYFWNSGMFVFRADVMLSEMERREPELLGACRGALAAGKRDADFIRLDPVAFEKAKSISIDYAVMEKTDKAAVVPCDIGWNDVGAWSSLWSLQNRDAHGNVTQGDVVLHEATNSLVRAEKGLTALVGVNDLVVVVTEDAVLVADRHRTQEVKAIVDKLKVQKRPELDDHKVVFRPWGSYQGIDAGDGYQVKHIIVKPGGRLSLQSHTKRAEHWIVVQGTAQVTCDDRVFLLNANESTFIPLGSKHRLENAGKTPLRLIEVQSGSYLGEDDIVRYEDVYGRAAPGNSATAS